MRPVRAIEELPHRFRTYGCGLNYLWGVGQPVQTLRDPLFIKYLCSQSTGGGLARETVGVVRSCRPTPRATGLRDVVDVWVKVPRPRVKMICCRKIGSMLCQRRHRPEPCVRADVKPRALVDPVIWHTLCSRRYRPEVWVRVANVDVRTRALVVPVISGRMGVWVVHWQMNSCGEFERGRTVAVSG